MGNVNRSDILIAQYQYLEREVNYSKRQQMRVTYYALILYGAIIHTHNDWWVYNIENDAWEEKTTYPAAARHHPFQFTDGRYVYVAFGHGNGFISKASG